MVAEQQDSSMLITNGELARRLDKLDDSFHSVTDRIFVKLDDFSTIFISRIEFAFRTDVVDARIQQLEQRLNASVDRKFTLFACLFTATSTGGISFLLARFS